jgi:glycosyltransferase involved in cell wall biosynthesis
MNDRSPLVSIGIPVYNGDKWLGAAIESLLMQTYANIELIISDNASTDGTEGICRKVAQSDARLRYIRNEKNIGGPGNFNAVFRAARGKYFKWASANDQHDRRLVERCLERIEADREIVVCYARTRLLWEESGVTEEYEDGMNLCEERPSERFISVLERMRLNNAMYGLIRRDVLARTPLMKPHMAEDVNLMAELALYGKFCEVQEFLFTRRMSRESATKLQSRSEVVKHYVPAGSSGMLFQNWKINGDYFTAVWRAPIVRHEKSRIYAYLMRQLLWQRKNLWADVREAVQYAVGTGERDGR